MKNYIIYPLICLLVVTGMVQTSKAQDATLQGKLEYMIKESPDRIFEIAQTENKPVLIYVHSQSCFSSKKFSREIMNHEKVKSLIRKRYVCMNADVNSKYGKMMAAKHNVLLMPALFLYSPDKGIMYQCKLEMDTFEMLTQFRSFVTACNLFEQVKLQRNTSNLGENEIIRQIGRSYALRDFQRDRSGDVSQRVAIRTLGLGYFKEFEVGYKEEWDALVASNGKHNGSEAASAR